MKEDAAADALPPEADDQARTLRLLVSSSPRAGIRQIIRDIEATGQRRSTPALSAFHTNRGSDSATIWTMPHRLIVVAGGRPGAGATTLARNLAVEAANRGVRAGYVGGNVGQMTEPGAADYYLVDTDGSADFEGLADYLVLVAAPDAEAATGAYAALKRFRASDPELAAGLVVNRVSSPGEGAALAERMASAARVFLGGPEIDVLGWVLEDDEVHTDAREAAPFIVRLPRAAAAAGVRLCARRLVSKWRRPKASAA